MANPWTRQALLLGALVAAMAAACSQSDADVARKKLAEYVLDQAPEIPKAANVPFGKALTLLGTKLEAPKEVKGGEAIRLTLYWRAEADLESGWELSSELVDEKGKSVMDLSGSGPLRRRFRKHQILPPGEWEKGKIYVDEVSFKVPAKITAKTLSVMVGVEREKEKLTPQSERGVKKGRLIVADLKTKVAGKPAKRKTPTFHIGRLPEGAKITVDGKLEEAAWQAAPAPAVFVNPATGKAPAETTWYGKAKALWDDQRLYLAFEVTDDDLQGGFPKLSKDAPLWKRDAVEVLIQPAAAAPGAAPTTVRLLVSPQKLLFDEQVQPAAAPAPAAADAGAPVAASASSATPGNWESKASYGVRLDGTLDDARDVDRGFTIELALPFQSLLASEAAPVQAGAAWKGNFGLTSQGNRLVWSAPAKGGALESPKFFGRWTFDGAPVAAVAAASAAPPANAAPPPAPLAPTETDEPAKQH